MSPSKTFQTYAAESDLAGDDAARPAPYGQRLRSPEQSGAGMSSEDSGREVLITAGNAHKAALPKGVIARHYAPATGAYVEIVDQMGAKDGFVLRYNWALSDEVYGGNKILPVERYKTLTEAEQGFSDIVTALPGAQKKMLSDAHFRLQKTALFSDISYRMRTHDLKKAFLASGFNVDMQDALRSNNYGFMEAADKAIGGRFIAREEAQDLVDEISAAYGLAAPQLYFCDEVAQYAMRHEAEDAYFAAQLVSQGMKGACTLDGRLFINEPKKITVLHEMTHWVERHASPIGLHQGHGEMYNRVFLQILDKVTNADTKALFDTMQTRGLFRAEVGYDDVMRPIGMHADPSRDTPIGPDV